MKIGLLFISFIFIAITIPAINIDTFIGIMMLLMSVISFIGFLFAFIEDYNLAKKYPNLCGKRQYLFERRR